MLWGRECAPSSCADHPGQEGRAPGLCTVKSTRGNSWSWEERLAFLTVPHHGGLRGRMFVLADPTEQRTSWPLGLPGALSSCWGNVRRLWPAATRDTAGRVEMQASPRGIVAAEPLSREGRSVPLLAYPGSTMSGPGHSRAN